MTDWFELGKLFISSGTTATVVVLIATALSKRILSRDLEKFKSSLEMETTTHKIRYERLHGERVEVIKEVYRKIVQADSSLASLVRIWQFKEEPPPEKKAETAAQHYNNLEEYYQRNRIFFEESLAKDIDAILKAFKNMWHSYYSYEDARKAGNGLLANQESAKTRELMGKTVPNVRAQLETKFRDILGIDNE